ncbi:hypothetical protein K488DRAFT_55625 [Vararia minispora EC-137]|uniref:Uncharacterized protein n=1 Tax=Vararia minispora EC-137 TaxID=1314806 RepID=A0ACB8QD97_9AGAM|nr:hypothetical protein K488DRAFT_55625 [Vararia minispora EC-137]
MGQYWLIINVDSKQQGYFGNLRNCFFDGILSRFLSARLCPLQPLPEMPKIAPTSKPADTNSNAERANPLSLPNELLYEIASNISDFADLLCFAASCHKVWDVCSEAVQEWVDEWATWDRCHIILLGDYTDELPENLLDKEDEADIREWLAEPNASKYEVGRSFYSYASDCYSSIFSSESARRRLKSALKDRPLSGAPAAAIERMLEVPDPKYTVLRNLSQKLYVRQKAVDELREELVSEFKSMGYPSAANLNLGDAVVCNICWSNDRSTSMSVDLTDGPWAGDCFDIVSMDELETDEEFSQWGDASKDVCATLRDCYESEYL